uniref:hypothetical protein n=1 Tax=Streptomyces viridosporus TaxID=67581 RepID=UPI001866355A|nr:hypothetical protein [Streptomyces viridosporus]
MSTPRRALGTGPSTTTRTSLSTSAPRLLPAERVVVDGLVLIDEHPEPGEKRRRTLGLGAGFQQ